MKLYHHPWSRAATCVWMLEEVDQPYELVFVDLKAGAQKSAEHTALNRMGKVPVLEDGEAVVSEVAAIGMYLADRYALGRLAPTPDDSRRGEYFRWCVFAPSVIEPACSARLSNWEVKPSTVGFGTYEDVVATLDEAVAQGPWLLGEQFTMADIIVGSTLGWMAQFKMLEPTENIAAYIDRIAKIPSNVEADAINQRVTTERGLG